MTQVMLRWCAGAVVLWWCAGAVVHRRDLVLSNIDVDIYSRYLQMAVPPAPHPLHGIHSDTTIYVHFPSPTSRPCTYFPSLYLLPIPVPTSHPCTYFPSLTHFPQLLPTSRPYPLSYPSLPQAVIFPFVQLSYVSFSFPRLLYLSSCPFFYLLTSSSFAFFNCPFAILSLLQQIFILSFGVIFLRWEE